MSADLPDTAHRTRLIAGLRDLASSYPVLLCDLWGVIHNGHHVFEGAAEALTRFREGGGTVVLVSNAPRPAEAVVPQLDRLGLPREGWNAIVTSGDVARSGIAAAARAGRGIYHLGPERDGPLFEGFPVRLVGESAAELIVCTGLFDDTTETPQTYRAFLQHAQERGIPMLCANPDLVVDRGGQTIYCAGALAQLYAELGGDVTTCGKPYRPIYDAALAIASSIRRQDVAPRQALMVGDSVRTDLAGAAALGCGALFIAGGIHGHEVKTSDGELDPELLASMLTRAGVAAEAALPRLVW